MLDTAAFLSTAKPQAQHGRHDATARFPDTMMIACRFILPQVEHLGLACRGLAVCSSCLPWGLHSLNLVFIAASNTTHERLDLTADLTSAFDANIQTTVWNARLARSGTPACEFEDDLFDDHVDGSGMSESSSSD